MSERDERAKAVPIEDRAANLRAHYEDISLKASDWHNQIPVAIDLWERWQKGELVERAPSKAMEAETCALCGEVCPASRERVSPGVALRQLLAREDGLCGEVLWEDGEEHMCIRAQPCEEHPPERVSEHEPGCQSEVPIGFASCCKERVSEQEIFQAGFRRGNAETKPVEQFGGLDLTGRVSAPFTTITGSPAVAVDLAGVLDLAAEDVRADALDAQAAEIASMRKAFETVFPARDGFTEAFDALVTAGLLVEVPSDAAYREWWGDEPTMWVWRWHPLATPSTTEETSP